jgi:uncharacterized RDD family membrane protein YckC
MFRPCYEGWSAGGLGGSAPSGGRYRVSVAERQAAGSKAVPGSEYPGERFGLPKSGAGSPAGVLRRLGALMIDWLMSVVIALAVLGGDKHPASVQYLAIAIFAVQVCLLTALTGFTVGKRLLALRVVRLDGKPVGLQRSLIRMFLFLLVVPPLVLDADLRGLHDRGASTIVIRI